MTHDYDDNEDEVLDAIEAEMNRDVGNDNIDLLSSAMNSTTITTSSLPSHQANHAAEFWFPECRDCECCEGFKHGCACGGLCTCSGGEKVEPSSSSLARGGNNGAASTPFVPASHGGSYAYGGSDNKTAAPCRFYASGKCNSGDRCRFSHEQSGGTSSGQPPPNNFGSSGFAGGGGNSTKQPCKFFASGKCNFGDGCRFSHETGGGGGGGGGSYY